MSSLYYLGVGVVSLSMTIYNFEISSRGGDFQCFSNDNYKESNIFKILFLIIAIVYLIMLVLALFLSCVINSLSNQTPDDYIDMGKCKRFLACFCKIFPPVFLILSWLNLILIVVVWIMIVIGKCENATQKRGDDLIPNVKSYYNDSKVLNLVNSIIWILLHYGGSIIRGMTYEEPFMYSPDTGEPANCFRTLMLKNLGP